MRRMIVSVLSISLLTACAASAATPTKIASTATLTVESSPSLTASSTYTEIPTPETTAEFEPTLPEATVSAMETVDAASLTACNHAESTGISPDGQWVAVQCNASSKSADYTKVFRLDGTDSWKISFYETYGRFHELTDGRMQLYHWSKDGNFTYLIPSFCCADAPGDIFFNESITGVGLYRLDLETGKLSTVLPPDTNIFAGYAFSFSPTDKYLAYLGPNNLNEINVYTLKSGSVEKISLNKYDFCGQFQWSTDSKKLAFICVLYESEDKQTYAYLWMDTADWVPNLLTKKEATYPENIPEMNWTEDNRLIVNP